MFITIPRLSSSLMLSLKHLFITKYNKTSKPERDDK